MKRSLGAFAALACVATTAPAQDIPQDRYGEIIEWKQPLGVEVTPIHAGLLPNGKLFFVNAYNFFENPGMNLRMPAFEPEYVFVMETTPPFAPTPASVTIQPIPNPPALRPTHDPATNKVRFKTLACSGHALTADGKLFFGSGVDAQIDLDLYAIGNLGPSLTVDGIAESFSLDGNTNAWTQHADTLVAAPVSARPWRWYSTVTRLADSRMLLTGGYEKVYPVLHYNNSVEIFDPAAGKWSVLSGIAETPPGLENPDYTHVFQFPYEYGDGIFVMMIGGSGEPVFLLTQADRKTWIRTGTYRPGAKAFLDASAPNQVHPNHGSSSVLLPLRLPGSEWGYGNGSVLYAGGEHHTPLQGNVDVYDPVANAWRASVRMHGQRHHPSTILLPDGRVLLLAGHDDQSAVDETGFAEYVDPRNGFTVTRGSAYMPEVRGYHTVTVLLPDGRVMIGGGNVDGRDARERTNFRYYYPDYMFKPRPELTHAPGTIRLKESFNVMVPRGTRVAEAALVGLGSMTHSYDMNQRHVQVAAADSGLTTRLVDGQWLPATAAQCQADPGNCYDQHVIQAPAAPEAAPPGHYMLFILDENRVPSAGWMLKLE